MDCLLQNLPRVERFMRKAHALALEGLSEVIKEADVALQHAFYDEYVKTMCDSTSGVAQLEFGDFIDPMLPEGDFSGS